MAGRIENLKPFRKGDPRINRRGRPKDMKQLRDLAQQIAHEPAAGKDGPIVIDNYIVTLAEAIMRKWATSNNPRLQQAFIEVAYGKVPTAVELGGPDGGPMVIQMTWGDIDVGDGAADDAA